MNIVEACLLAFAVLTLFCASGGDLLAELVRAAAVETGILPPGYPLPGINWLGATLGASLPLALPVGLLVLFQDTSAVAWLVGTAWLAGMVGVVVELPCSVVRNRWMERPLWWTLTEVFVLCALAAFLAAVLLVLCRLSPTPTNWAALG
jgi:hypothetical protein